MSGARSRRKGATWERDIAERLRPHYPEAQRGPWGSQRPGECDVEGTEWWIEAKVGARPDLLGAIAQGEDATDGRPVVVIAKRDREAPVVAMRLEVFELLLRERKLEKLERQAPPIHWLSEPDEKTTETL